MKFTAIRENHLFVKAYQGGRRAGTKSCTVYLLKDRQARRVMKARPDKKFVNRIGISASKKIGGAVSRNRAKRVIREALRLIMKEYRLKTGYLLVIAAREKATVCKMQDVYRDLQYAFAKLELYASAVPTAGPVEPVSRPTVSADRPVEPVSNPAEPAAVPVEPVSGPTAATPSTASDDAATMSPADGGDPA